MADRIHASFGDMRLGIFLHYAYNGDPYYAGILGRKPDGTQVGGLDELADGLDVEDLVSVAASMNAEYLQFSAWHANLNMLYPSEVMPRYLPGHYSKRDVIRDLIDAIKDTGIELILYVHPNMGVDLTEENRDKTGWNDEKPRTRWKAFMDDIFEELAGRYKGDIAGYWFDAADQLPGADTIWRTDPESMTGLVEKVHKQDPGIEIIVNGHHAVGVWADFGSGESISWPNASPRRRQVNQIISTQWWADHGYAWFSPELAYQYTVMQAAVDGASGGGVAWCSGPYPGGKWEPGVREFYQRLGKLIEPVKRTILGTRPSRSFITTEEAETLSPTLNVATESDATGETFVHVLRPPKEKTVKLPVPADGRKYTQAYLFESEKTLSLEQDDDGVRIQLSPADEWGSIDTVIVLK